MRISRRFKRIVSAMLATALAFTMTFSTNVMPLADSKQDQLKAEVSAKQAELDKVNAALKEAQSNKENAEPLSAPTPAGIPVRPLHSGENLRSQ